MLTLHETAQSAIDAGISVLPIKPDGSKAPATGSWKRYQSERMSYGELLPHLDQHCGVAFIGGMVSGNLECLDFDDAEVYVAFTELCRVAGLGDLLERLHGYSESTPAAGCISGIGAARSTAISSWHPAPIQTIRKNDSP